jgi:hypothetical protein
MHATRGEAAAAAIALPLNKKNKSKRMCCVRANTAMNQSMMKEDERMK